MLCELRLTNYRGFEDHIVPFRPVTIVVGRNNAGKSTIVEALRLISIVGARYRGLTYRPPTEWLDIPRRDYGVSPSLRNIEIDFRNLFHQYREPPAVVQASFSDGTSITIYLGERGRIHAVVKSERNEVVSSRTDAQRVKLPKVSIMPQVAPVAREEAVLTQDYVKSAISSPLAPLHFRNQLKVYYELFQDFQRIVEETWPGLRVTELNGRKNFPGDPLFLHVRIQDFVGEIAIMGHGVQMWLQTMWFLTHSRHSQTVILDEPDVYMHADLQRKLIRFLRDRYPQIIVTTHSIEIMSEVEPEEILVVDRRSSHSQFAGTLPAVQKVIEHVGSTQNIHLARLWHSRRFILLEGKDLKIMKHLKDKLFPDSEEPIDTIPNMPVGGWSGWNHAVGSSMALRNALGETITTYCILDADYHTEETIKERYRDAERRGVKLHIWSQKEIENYLLVPAAISRLIKKQATKGTTMPSPQKIRKQMENIAQDLEVQVFDALSTELFLQDRSLGSGGANKLARKILKSKKNEPGGLLALVSGKAVISQLSRWTQKRFGVALNAVKIAREIRAEEIPEEVVEVISAIEQGGPFSRTHRPNVGAI